jgi:hypothetical protein
MVYLAKGTTKSVAAALAGEVQGFIGVTKFYGAQEFLTPGYRSPIDDHPFPVFEANVGKIGFCHRILPAMLPDSIALPGE